MYVTFLQFLQHSFESPYCSSHQALVAGRYRAYITCWTSFWHKKFLNSQLIKVGPLSDTTLFGRPNCAMIVHGCWMVARALIVGIGWTSNHLECASITNKNIWPLKRPAKSMWKWDQGQLGRLGLHSSFSCCSSINCLSWLFTCV